MKATDYLKKQHREVENLFSKIEKAESGREKRALFLELADKIENHAKIEEKIFYPEGRQADEDMTLEAYEEHSVVRAQMRKLRKTKTSDEYFGARISVLKDLIAHHVKEEEEQYFPKCEKTLGDETLEELATELELAYEKLSQKGSTKQKRKAA